MVFCVVVSNFRPELKHLSESSYVAPFVVPEVFKFAFQELGLQTDIVIQLTIMVVYSLDALLQIRKLNTKRGTWQKFT